jgi:WD40 repeat protein
MIPIHKAPVRDLQINQAQELVVTTSFDAQLAVTNLNSHSVVWKTTIPRQGWSCTFSQIDPFAIFCGFNDGTIAKYDLRRSASCHSNGMVEPVITYHMSMRQPVHSVRIGISNNSISSEGKEMLFGATFSRFASWKCLNQDQEGGTPIVLPLEIPVTNCSALTNCQGNSHQVLVSSRTQGTSLPAKLQLFDMSKEGSSGGADGADGANGADGADRAPWCVLTGHRTPSVLSRTTMWYSAEGIPLIAAGDEESKQILVWNAKTKQIVSRICHGMERPIIDLAHIVQNGSWQNQKALFGALSAQQFVLYQS